MRYEFGKPFNIGLLNIPFASEVVSEPVFDGITVHSLASNTDIPVQNNPNFHGLFVVHGKLHVFTKATIGEKESWDLNAGQAIILPMEEPHAFRAMEDAVAVEVTLGQRINSKYIQELEVFTVADEIENQGAGFMIKELFNSGFFTFILATIDSQMESNEYCLSGESVMVVLEGNVIFHYKGVDIPLGENESIRIEAGANYSLQTLDQPFKCAVLTNNE